MIGAKFIFFFLVPVSAACCADDYNSLICCSRTTEIRKCIDYCLLDSVCVEEARWPNG